MTSAGSLAVGAAGALIVALALVDLFVTVFNYDGFSFIANRFHGVCWSVLRAASRPLPRRARHAALSLGSAAMLPATVSLWLGLEIVGFAMIFKPGLDAGSFTLNGHLPATIGTAFYLSGGAISSLTFGDVVPHTGLYQALVDLETVVGLSTFTLALGYVVTTFDTFRSLDSLHSTVRRHAEEPQKPSSILARHFRGGEPAQLPDLLESLAEKLETYDEGLRRYPVVYYFHTRRVERSIPRVFAMLGELVALLRWGLPTREPVTQDPGLAALLDEYVITVSRLQRSFVGPDTLRFPQPLPADAFWDTYERRGADPCVDRFRELRERALDATGVEPAAGPRPESVHDQYREWLPFRHRQRVFLDRIADALGYEHA